jgi:TRAP-type C4-dicarboxylate transport system substrate-binding protein
MITRRQVNLGAVSAAALWSTGGLAQTQTFELKVSHYLPPNHTVQKTLVAWAAELDKLSNGRLKLTIYPSGQLGGGANRQFDSCRNGVVDIALSMHAATPGRYSTTELISLPYASPSAGDASAIASKRLTELAPTYLAQEHQGLKILWLATIPALKYHSKNPIRKMEDFKGMKIRYAGVQYKNMIDALGAVPLPVPPPETQDALSKGIVEAAIFSYEGAASFGLETVVAYSLEPGVSSLSMGLVMNTAKFNSLPDDLKALIEKTTGVPAAENFGKAFDQAELEGKQKLISKGVQVVVTPPDELAKMKKLFAPQVDAAIADVEKQGRPGRKFFEAFSK